MNYNHKLASTGAKWFVQEMKNCCMVLYPDKVSVLDCNIVITDNSLAEAFARFEQLLIKELKDNLDLYNFISMGCCYRPNRTLAMLAERANISTAYFPQHAHLEIANKTIWVSIDRQEPYKLRVSN